MSGAHDSGTHDVHHTANVSADVPISKGIGPAMYFLIGLSLFAIFMQGIFVEVASSTFHVWPASDSAKIQLPPEK